MHSRDNQRLIAILRQLRDQGNTVLVVEHDEDMIRVADHVVDIGLGAGEQGGRVVYSGDLPGLLQEPRSLTAKYMRHELAIPVPSPRRKGVGQRIRLRRDDISSAASESSTRPAVSENQADAVAQCQQLMARMQTYDQKLN